MVKNRHLDSDEKKEGYLQCIQGTIELCCFSCKLFRFAYLDLELEKRYVDLDLLAFL